MVGQILKVRQNEFFPADLICIGTSDHKGLCYVETKNLDGETNLKLKIAPKTTQAFCDSDRHLIRSLFGGQVECEAPNQFLYKFDGTLTLEDEMIALDPEQLLLRGSSLRNTEFVYGVVVFTGHQTKIMMNSVSARPKRSQVEK